jgi:Protein of unknown function (DUF1524)
MSNDPFNAKKQRLGESLLALNIEFPTLSSWDEPAIQKRGVTLANVAVSIWPSI